MSRRYLLGALVAASGMSESALARTVGLSGSTLKQARERGFLEQAADRYAVRAGLHPFQVWPEMADHADPSRACAADGCGELFLPHERAPHALYCSPRCRNREKARRYRATPHGAETNRRHRRSYYAANSAYELDLKRRERGAAARRRAKSAAA